MTDQKSPTSIDGNGEMLTRDSRKPYQCPQILSRERLEAMAAVCSGGGAKAYSNPACSVVSS